MEILKGKSVVQDWVSDLPLMQQTVLLSAVRGCDGMAKYHKAKPLVRWYRRCILLSAFDGATLLSPFSPGGGSFAGPIIGGMDEKSAPYNEPHRELLLKTSTDDFIVSRDDMHMHYFTHMMHAFQIVGYKHPIKEIQSFWREVYCRMVYSLHLWPESQGEMDKRLGDNEEGWRKREDSAGSCST